MARQFAEANLRDLAEAVRNEPDPARRADLARPAFAKAVEAGFLKGLIPVAVRRGREQRGGRGHPHRGVGVAQPGLRHLDGGPADRPGAGVPGRDARADPALRRAVPRRQRHPGGGHGLLRARRERQLRRPTACRGHAHHGGAGRRRLRDQREQGVGVAPARLGRRRPRRHDDRLPRPGRGLAPRRRTRAPRRAHRGAEALRPARPARLPHRAGAAARRPGAAGQPARRRGPGRRAHPQRLHRQRRLDRDVRGGGDAPGVRRRLPLRHDRTPRRRRPDHRAPGRLRRARQRQGPDRGRPPAVLAGPRRRAVGRPAGARSGRCTPRCSAPRPRSR